MIGVLNGRFNRIRFLVLWICCVIFGAACLVGSAKLGLATVPVSYPRVPTPTATATNPVPTATPTGEPTSTATAPAPVQATGAGEAVSDTGTQTLLQGVINYIAHLYNYFDGLFGMIYDIWWWAYSWFEWARQMVFQLASLIGDMTQAILNGISVFWRNLRDFLLALVPWAFWTVVAGLLGWASWSVDWILAIWPSVEIPPVSIPEWVRWIDAFIPVSVLLVYVWLTVRVAVLYIVFGAIMRWAKLMR